MPGKRFKDTWPQVITISLWGPIYIVIALYYMSLVIDAAAAPITSTRATDATCPLQMV